MIDWVSAAEGSHCADGGLMDFAVIDFETATSRRDSACALGMCLVADGAVTETRHWLIRPPANEYSDFNRGIHGIGPEDTRDAPEFVAVFEQALQWSGPLPLVAHNAAFDLSVVRYALDSAGVGYPRRDYYCTLLMSRAHWPTLPGYSLPIVAACCDVGLDHHHAESDALAAAKVLLRIAQDRDSSDLEQLSRGLGLSAGHLNEWGYSPCSLKTGVAATPKTKLKVGQIESNTGADPAHPFFDADIAFTGTLLSMSRDTAMTLVGERGGRPRTSVSIRTEYLVVGSVEYRSLLTGEPSRKMQKALELRDSGAPVVILSEQEFLEHL